MQENKFSTNSDDVSIHLHCKIKDVMNKGFCLDNAESYNTTHVAECLRRQLYRVYGEEQEKCINASFTHKNIVNKWIDILSKIPEITILSNNVLVSDWSYNIEGTIDISCAINNKNIIISVYLIGDQDYKNIIENGATRKNIVDTTMKMWLSKVKHAIIIYDNVVCEQQCLFHVTPYKPIILSACDKCNNMEVFRIKGSLPERSNKDRNCNECSVCEYETKCWKGTQ